MFKQGNVMFVTEIVFFFCVLYSLELVFVVLGQVELQHSGYLWVKSIFLSVMFAVLHSNVGEISVGQPEARLLRN